MTKQWLLYDIETDAIKDGAEDEFWADCPHGSVLECIKKSLDDQIFSGKVGKQC